MRISNPTSQNRSNNAWAAGAVALAAYAVCASPLVSYDFWWHLAAGSWIMEHAAVPHADPFSHTMAGSPWIDFEWLFQVLLHAAHRAGGFSFVVALKGMFAAAAVALVFYACKTAGATPAAAAMGSAYFLPLLRARTFARPELVTLLLLPYFVLLIHQARQSRRTATLIPTIFLGALWANLHGGFVYGIGILVLAEIGSIAAGDHGRRPRYGWIALLVTAATLLNPYGWNLYTPILSHLSDLANPTASGIGGIQEWSRTGIGDAPLFWILLTVGWGLALRDRTTEDRFWAPALLIFGLWGAAQVRNPALFAIICLPLLAKRIKSERGAALAAAVLLAFSLWGTRGRRSSPVRWERIPQAATDFLKDSAMTGKTFTDYEFGGYWNWKFAGTRPGFFDGRYLFHGLVAQEQQALRIPGAFSDFLDSRHIDIAIVGYGRTKFPRRFPRDRWALHYWDDVAMIYKRRGKSIRAREYRLTDPEFIDALQVQVQQGLIDRGTVLTELQRHRRETGFSVRNQVLTDIMTSTR